ncbi:MAG: hypothetical protein M1598_07660 [Actinobacteria bacterium]|nr:hypothetical protein [Actinomycetota bacterium]
MVLAGEELIKRLPEVIPEAVIDKSKNIWEYDLRLGPEVYLSGQQSYISIKPPNNPIVTIRPGEFALLTTYEMVKMPPDIMGFISVRFRYKRKGLINISGFHVDPCYRGTILFSVYNAGPTDIVLRYKEAVFMIFFQQLSHPVESQRDPITHISGEFAAEVQGKSVSLVAQEARIDQLESSLRLYAGVAAGIVIPLFGIIISLLLTRL